MVPLVILSDVTDIMARVNENTMVLGPEVCSLLDVT